MSNTKHVDIGGRLPCDCIQPDPDSSTLPPAAIVIRDWLALMNTPTFGLRIHWTGPVESKRNKYGGRTAFYAFHISGTESVAWTAIDTLLAAITDCGGSVNRNDVHDLEG